MLLPNKETFFEKALAFSDEKLSYDKYSFEITCKNENEIEGTFYYNSIEHSTIDFTYETYTLFLYEHKKNYLFADKNNTYRNEFNDLIENVVNGTYREELDELTENIIKHLLKIIKKRNKGRFFSIYNIVKPYYVY